MQDKYYGFDPVTADRIAANQHFLDTISDDEVVAYRSINAFQVGYDDVRSLFLLYTSCNCIYECCCLFHNECKDT